MTLDDVVSKITDPYERPARLYPALLTLLPLLAIVMLYYGPKASAMTGAVTVAISCGGLYLTTNLCREFGKLLEHRLYLEWGGKPTTQLLRHRDTTIEGVTKQRYHQCLANKINVSFPSRDQESNDPAAADDIYQSGVRWLLNHTRPDDGKKFELLFKENVAYGFRRNALGMKPIGLLISIGSLLWVLLKEGVLLGSGRPVVDLAAVSHISDAGIAAVTVSMMMLVAWMLFFTKTSARTAAFTYAETLLRACDSL